MKLYPVNCFDSESGMSGVIATFTSEGYAKGYIDNDTGDGILTIADPIDHNDTYFEDKAVALADYLGCSLESVADIATDTYESEDEPGEYRVLTDREADEAFKESVEQYVEDCVLSQLPEQYRYYFDTERFIRDVELSDGRGPSLASYDGAENEAQVDGTWYFIYRVN